jgi:hypothetical protein
MKALRIEVVDRVFTYLIIRGDRAAVRSRGALGSAEARRPSDEGRAAA